MLLNILTHTPLWVFPLLALLVYWGLRQMLPHQASLKRITLLPLGMAGLSLYSVLSGFNSQPLALPLWALTSTACALITLQQRLPDTVRYHHTTQRFDQPGSAVPLALMLGIFSTKYLVGATLSLWPELAQTTSFALLTSSVYGAFSGIFIGRAWRLWRKALHANTSLPTINA